MMPMKRNAGQNWLPSIFNDFFDTNWVMKANATAPAINVMETEKAYKVEVAAPGMCKDDFDIHINKDNDLVITMEKKCKCTDCGCDGKDGGKKEEKKPDEEPAAGIGKGAGRKKKQRGHKGQPQQKFGNLRPPAGGFGIELNESAVHLVDDPHTQGTAQEFVGILHSVAEVIGINVSGEGEQSDVEHESDAHGGQNAHEGVHELALRAEFLEQRPQSENEDKGHQDRHADVQGSMHAQVHPCKGNE